jgi:hypothetical protein
MTARDWSPEPPPIQEHPQLRLFLDRASAVVAQCGGLNAKSRVLLGKLAEELGISREEAEPVIHTLLIATEDFTPGKSNGSAVDRPRRPPPLPKAGGNGEQSEPGEPPPVVMIDDEVVLNNFAEQAAYILEQHGRSAKTRVVLMQLAQSMGVTPAEMESALAALGEPPQVERSTEGSVAPEPPPAPPFAGDVSFPMEHHAPPAPPLPDEPPAAPPLESPSQPAPPPRTQPAPQEVYCSYLKKAMDDLRRPRINPRREQRLIEQGVHKLGLSPVYARQLLCDVARERQVEVESQTCDTAAPQPQDDRTAAFIARARAVIAEQRGVTGAGQIKISAAAQELGLSDEEWQRALAQLQEGAAPRSLNEIRRLERLSGYREWLREAIAALPRRIITPDVVERLVAAGCDCHGLASDDADAAVREVAAHAGARFISQQRAVEHVAGRVSEKMAGSAVLYPTDRQRILVEGAQWGLAPQDVEAIIGEQVEINRRVHAARRKRMGIAIAAIGAAAFVLACLVLGSMLRRDRGPGGEVAAPGEAATGGSAPSADSSPPDAWWDVDLSVAMSRAEVELPYLRAPLANVRSYSPNVRGDAYRQTLAGLPRALESRTAMAVLRDIVSGAYALDPSDAAAQQLRRRLLEPLPDPKSDIPAKVADMREAYAAAELAVAAATREGVSESRADEMRRGLGQALAFTPDPSWDESQLRRESAAALSRIYYRVATAVAASHPAAVQPMHDFISSEAERHLDAQTVARLDAEFLKKLLPADESVWRQYHEPILRVVAAEDKDVVLSGVELLEECQDENLRYYLAAGLLRRIGQPLQGQSPEEVAAAVREEFGDSAAPARAAEEGWRQFSGEAAEQLSRLAAPGAEPLVLLEETANLARLSAMGCVLSQGEMGRAAFDELKDVEPFFLERRSTDSSSSASTADSSPRARALSRQIDSLSRASHPVQRIGYLKAIAENSLEIHEIEPQEGKVIAEYLLAAKGDEEREAIAGLIPRVGKWKLVRLAAADLIVDTPVRQELVEEVVARLLGQEPEAPGGADWRERARRKLMQSVLSGGVASSSVHPFDEVRERMLAMYQTQAQTAGVASSSYSGAASPTAILPPLIEKFASRLAAEAVPEDDRNFLTRIPHELAAAEYLADNDLRRLALLERIWLRLVAIDALRTRSDRAAEVHAIMDKFNESDRGSPDVFHQLRDGQVALVQLWLLRAP